MPFDPAFDPAHADAVRAALETLAREVYGEGYDFEVRVDRGGAVLGVGVEVSAGGGDPCRALTPAALSALGIDAEDGDGFVLTLHAVPAVDRPALVQGILTALGITPAQDAAFLAAAEARLQAAIAAHRAPGVTDEATEFVDDLRGAFLVEVPELAAGQIAIERVAWDAASRHAKIAVRSDVADLDPVGAMLGHRGQRLRPVLERLGCTLDVVQASRDPYRFLVDAMGAASALRWRFDDAARHATLLDPTWTYDPREEPTAAAREAAFATNLRLAEALTGWAIATEGEITWIDGTEALH